MIQAPGRRAGGQAPIAPDQPVGNARAQALDAPLAFTVAAPIEAAQPAGKRHLAAFLLQYRDQSARHAAITGGYGMVGRFQRRVERHPLDFPVDRHAA